MGGVTGATEVAKPDLYGALSGIATEVIEYFLKPTYGC
jgi:hypothetical protein